MPLERISSRTMKRFCRWLVVFLAGLSGSPSGASVIDPSPWEEIVERSAFVGTVECEVAGGIVAEYRVLEVWKGAAKPGQRIRIRIWPDEQGQSFPAVLCGERCVVAAGRNPDETSAPEKPPYRVPLWGQPLMWRTLKWDYQTSLYQGMTRLVPGEEASVVAKQRKDTLEFLAASAEQQELIILQQNFEKYVGWMIATVGVEKPKPTWVMEDAIRRIRAAGSVSKFAEELLRLRVLGGANGGRVAGQTFEHGSEGTLKFVSQFTDAELPEKSEIVRMFELRHRVVTAASGIARRFREYPFPVPTESEIEQVAVTLQDADRGSEGTRVLTWMIEHRPNLAAEVLLGWTPRKHPAHVWDVEGYVLGSKFAKYCPSNRVALLTRLLEAKDPYIRVSAGVYLCFDDRAAGMKALERLQSEPGDAGAWAALTLARRGRQEAVGRTLDLFNRSQDPRSERARMWEQWSQLSVLLSNSARAVVVVMPENPNEIREWWAKNSDKIKVGDPWMAELDLDRTD